jgi:hypothetical protein
MGFRRRPGMRSGGVVFSYDFVFEVGSMMGERWRAGIRIGIVDVDPDV